MNKKTSVQGEREQFDVTHKGEREQFDVPAEMYMQDFTTDLAWVMG